MSSAARKALERALEEAKRTGKSQIFSYPQVPCKGPCMGFHVTPSVAVTPEGKFYYIPSPYGFHSKAVNPPQPRKLKSIEEAVNLMKKLLSEARYFDPFMKHEFYALEEEYYDSSLEEDCNIDCGPSR